MEVHQRAEERYSKCLAELHEMQCVTDTMYVEVWSMEPRSMGGETSFSIKCTTGTSVAGTVTDSQSNAAKWSASASISAFSAEVGQETSSSREVSRGVTQTSSDEISVEMKGIDNSKPIYVYQLQTVVTFKSGATVTTRRAKYKVSQCPLTAKGLEC
ncbi:hypothetical protein GPECTOR_67g309 [Gonium pectorale]|uniref:Uncharacterized protein n=1 Tax=Gonium pectorale TaxID=33097 RepID=A0A150G3L4_GONPE|nr:hypothetical protein GPECTOR_67g309 [Gonium pectorale]|eukprot:KXZ44469.1 hypothetical protein GPECTOR_67g309 [Gonium pectorale]